MDIEDLNEKINDDIHDDESQGSAEVVGGGKLIDVEINSEMKNSFLSYSMSVITSRALPDVRDGLKPVHRRILYTMYENKLFPNVAYRKCADTVGSVLGRYHPHGDASVYDAMVRLAQDFSMRYPLVDGHGNFGSVDGDPPAAYRYTESRMSKLTLEMLKNIDEETVDFVPNYDDRLKEPTVLPSKYPNLLVNGSTGIAVGMATNIPPHNLCEVIDAAFCLMDNPDATLADLMQHIKGPDFPTNGIIMGQAGIRAAYATGRGKITLRSRTEIQELKNGKYQIIVTELPYQVNKARLIESIADLVKDKKIDGITDVNDYSNRHGMKIVIDLRRDANPQVILNQLFQFTQLQISYGIIMLALVNGEPKILTLKQMLELYIDHQVDIITRRTKFRLNKALDRQHILDGLIKALDIIDEIIALLRASKSIADGKQGLIEKFGFDDIQATHIVQMRLGQLTGLERQKLDDELAEINAKIAEYREILSSREKVFEVIEGELKEIKEKYGDERRTEIQSVSGEMDIEDLIPEENCIFTLTTYGYIKRQNEAEYKLQNRGGKGVIGMKRREDDIAESMFTCSTHDEIMFYSSRGRVYRLKGYEIPEGSRTSKGTNVINLLQIEQGEKITSMLRVPRNSEENQSVVSDNENENTDVLDEVLPDEEIISDEIDEEIVDEQDEEIVDDNLHQYLCMFTKRGIIKRTPLSLFKSIRKKGLNVIRLDDGDELVKVLLTDGTKQFFVATKDGLGIRFNESQIRPIGRTARGVKAISLSSDDEVVGVDTVDDNSIILTVSEQGYGRRTMASEFNIQSRGGKGKINYHTEKYGKVAAVKVVDDDEDVILISSDGVIIRIPCSSISIISRTGKGVKVMRVNDGEKLMTMTTCK